MMLPTFPATSVAGPESKRLLIGTSCSPEGRSLDPFQSSARIKVPLMFSLYNVMKRNRVDRNLLAWMHAHKKTWRVCTWFSVYLQRL